MHLLTLLVARFCFMQLAQIIVENAMMITAGTFVCIALAISHKMHMITGR